MLLPALQKAREAANSRHLPLEPAADRARHRDVRQLAAGRDAAHHGAIHQRGSAQRAGRESVGPKLGGAVARCCEGPRAGVPLPQRHPPCTQLTSDPDAHLLVHSSTLDPNFINDPRFMFSYGASAGSGGGSVRIPRPSRARGRSTRSGTRSAPVPPQLERSTPSRRRRSRGSPSSTWCGTRTSRIC